MVVLTISIATGGSIIIATMIDATYRPAISATLHCLTGCAIGEVLGNVIGSTIGWSVVATEVLAVLLAFIFGYGLTMRPLLRGGFKFSGAVKLALASDSLSITTMEIVDTAFLLLIPAAVTAGPNTLLFWTSLAASLVIAFIVTVPVNRYLISRGKGHALMHEHHHKH
jgi:hypothetical protein